VAVVHSSANLEIDAAAHVRAISSLIFARAFRFALGEYLVTEDVTVTLNHETFAMFEPAILRLPCL
jgi:hypothetical protein